MYKTKTTQEYSETIRSTNSCKRFMDLWRNEFAPARYIGHVNNLYDKYKMTDYYLSGKTPDECVFHFIESYLNDSNLSFSYHNAKISQKGYCSDIGRSSEQLTDIAENLKRRCSEIGILGENKYYSDISKLEDVIIGHACYETVLGALSELRVRKYLEYKGINTQTLLNIDEESYLDSFGTDIFMSDGNNKIYGFIQVKPISFLFGKGSDLVKDRAKCYSNEEELNNFIHTHPQYFRDGNEGGVDTSIRYIFYDKSRNYGFVKFPIDGKQQKFIHVYDFTTKDGKPLIKSSELAKYETDSLIR